MTTKYDFSGHQILITGAGKGIGRSLVKALYQANADKIFAVTRTESDLTSLISECLSLESSSSSKSKIIPIVLDLSLEISEIEKILKPIFENNEINHLVNNAGVNVLEKFLDLSEEGYDRVMKINLKSPVFIAKMFANSVKSRIDHPGRNSTILNVSSQASVVPIQSHTSYCLSKAALDMATKMMALELSDTNCRIKVNSINPTVVLTELGKAAWTDPEKAAPMKAKIPSGRFAEVEDVVQPILFLLSGDSQMINASNNYVDGGFVNCN